jgi:hypothetical protein
MFIISELLLLSLIVLAGHRASLIGARAEATGNKVTKPNKGANPSISALPLEQLPGKANYFIGRDPKRWRTGVRTYGKIKYSGIYPGIDLICYGKRGRLEFDFVLAPGADPDNIRHHLDAPGPLSIRKDGTLSVATPGGSFGLMGPEIYQVRNGNRVPLSGRFVLSSDTRTVGIRVAKYDHQAQLIIDPLLVYSTFLGGSGTEYAGDLAIDSRGDAYLMGWTTSLDFPTYNGYPASGNSNGVAFVTELNPTGTALSIEPQHKLRPNGVQELPVDEAKALRWDTPNGPSDNSVRSKSARHGMWSPKQHNRCQIYELEPGVCYLANAKRSQRWYADLL